MARHRTAGRRSTTTKRRAPKSSTRPDLPDRQVAKSNGRGTHARGLKLSTKSAAKRPKRSRRGRVGSADLAPRAAARSVR